MYVKAVLVSSFFSETFHGDCENVFTAAYAAHTPCVVRSLCSAYAAHWRAPIAVGNTACDGLFGGESMLRIRRALARAYCRWQYGRRTVFGARLCSAYAALWRAPIAVGNTARVWGPFTHQIGLRWKLVRTSWAFLAG